MAIITVMVLALVIFIPAMAIEGMVALYHRAKEARTWRNLKKIHY